MKNLPQNKHSAADSFFNEHIQQKYIGTAHCPQANTGKHPIKTGKSRADSPCVFIKFL